MPRFYFHLYNDLDSPDEEGVELADAAGAREHALEECRAMACEALRMGHLNLDHRIEIENEAGERTPVSFRDAFTLEG